MPRIVLIGLLLLVASASSAVAGTGKPTIAVLYFDNNSGDPSLDVLSKGFADMLITDLSASDAIIVVEREKLQELLAEAKLQRTRFFDPKTAVKLGKGLGARFVLSGSFLQVKPRLRIDVRMIDVQTSNVVLATQVSGSDVEIFSLEQKLVSSFLRKLNLKFYAAQLPPTKVPNLSALLSYSKALSLADQGKDKQAAALMKKLMSSAPTFGLARVQHGLILKRLSDAVSQHANSISRDSKRVFNEARDFLKSHRTSELDAESARHYLAYRILTGMQIAQALHALTQGRSATLRAVSRTKPGRAIALARAFYENQRLLLREHGELTSRLGPLGPRLPSEIRTLARSVHLEPVGRSPAETMLKFLLLGEVPAVGSLKSYRMVPALADIDPKMKRAALSLAKARLALVAPLGPRNLAVHQADVLDILARWHFERARIEEGIGELQKVLDRFPKLRNWARYEKRIKEQLGIVYNHSVSVRARYRKGITTCNHWDYIVGLGPVFSTLVHSKGLQAIPILETQLSKSCKKAAKFSRMQKRFYQEAFLEAARLGDCAWFDKYVKKWLDAGGSARDAAGYRKNYSSCHQR